MAARTRKSKGSTDADLARGHLRPVAGRLERVHDLRLVRAPEEPGGEALVDCGAGELGDRAVRVSADGAGQPHRLRRAVAAAAEDPAGGDHARGVRSVRHPVHGPAGKARLPLGCAVHHGRGVLRVSWINSGTWWWRDRSARARRASRAGSPRAWAPTWCSSSPTRTRSSRASMTTDRKSTRLNSSHSQISYA